MSENHRKSSFEDHMNTISSGQTKTASVKNAGGNELLAKLAAELGVGEIPITGAKTPAEASPVGANPATVGATEALVTPQVVLAGGDEAVVAKGETPLASGPFAVTPVISSGTGDAQTAETLNKTDEAVAAASRGAGGAQAGKLESAAVAQNPPQGSEAEKNASEAVKIGQIIAHSFQETLEKQAQDVDYANALIVLDSYEKLAGYNIKDMPNFEKQASSNGLAKIAAMQPLTREDIIDAATQIVELQKQADDAEMQGRQEAHAFVELLAKMAEETEKEETEDEKKKKEHEVAETAEKEKEEEAKTASLRNDPAVMGAVRILKSKGLI